MPESVTATLPAPAPAPQYPVTGAKIGKVRGASGGLKLLCIGDSKVWGTVNGAALNPAGPGGSSWPSQLVMLLNSFDVPAVIGLSIPQDDNTNVPATDNRWAPGAGWASGKATYPAGALYGLGGTASWIGGVGAADMSYTPGTLCDTADVYYVQTAGLGTMKVAADAASAGGTAVNCAVGTAGVNKVTLTFAAGSAHVINVGTVAGAAVVIVGIEAYLSTGGAIRVGNCGCIGTSAYQFADRLVSSSVSSLATIRGFAPDLTIINLSGTIDGLFSFSASMVQQSIESVIAACEASGDVILMSETPTLNIGAVGPVLPLEATMAAWLAAYAQANGYVFVDAYSAFLPSYGFQAQGFYNYTAAPTDAFHLSPNGNALVAYLALRGVLRAQAASAAPTVNALVVPVLNAALWAAAAVLAAGVSASAQVSGCRSFLIFGNTNAATTLTVQVSADNVAWFNTSVQLVAAGAGDFAIDCRALVGAPFVRLISSAAATITARITGVS